MALIRDIPFTMVALPETLLVTCSEIISTAASTAVNLQPVRAATGDTIVSTGDIGMLTTDARNKLVSSGGMATANGVLIDRLRYPLGAHYQVAVISAQLASTRGSTEADRKLAIGCKLQEGDSSGGGDLADYSTGHQPDDRLYFGSTIRTTDMTQWDTVESSGAVYAVSNPGVYDLRNAGRYLRVVARVGKNSVTTESSGDEQSRVSAMITFAAGDVLAPALDTTSPYSSTTST